MKNLTQNRRCLSAGIFSSCSIELSAGSAISEAEASVSRMTVPAATIDERVKAFSNFIFTSMMKFRQNGEFILELIWYQTDRFQNFNQFGIVSNNLYTDRAD